jgi:hypothetical protein
MTRAGINHYSPVDAAHAALAATKPEMQRTKAPARRQGAGDPAGQRDGDDLGREIGGLHPSEPVERDLQRRLDLGQRAGDDLDVEHRHEHADAHRDKPDPESQARHGTPAAWVHAAPTGRSKVCC